MEQIFKYFVVALFAREESLGARRHFAIASCGVRQVPFFEIRSFLVSIFMHVVSEDGVLAVAVAVDIIEITKAKTRTLALSRNIVCFFMVKLSRFQARPMHAK